MIIGTVFTLFVVPSIYMLVARNARRGAGAAPARATRPRSRTGGGSYERAVLTIASLRSRASALLDRRPRRRRSRRRAGRRCSSRSTTRCGAPSSTIPIWRSCGSAPKSRPRASARAAARSRRCSRRRSAARATSTPPSNFLLGRPRRRRRTTGSRRPASGSGCRGAPAPGASSWDTARTTTNNPISSFDPSLQSGVQVAFSQPLLRDRTIDAARQQYIIAKRNQRQLGAALPRVGRPDGGRRQAGVLDAEGDASPTSPCSSGRWSWRRSSRAQNRIRVDAGQIPPLDLVQAEAEVAQRRENLIRAQRPRPTTRRIACGG